MRAHVMILHPQTGHGGVRRQPCRSRLPAGRSLSSAALSWSDDDVYRLAASPGQLAPSLLPRELHVERPRALWASTSTHQGVLAAPARRPPCPGSPSCRRHCGSPAHPPSLICLLTRAQQARP
eukprot:scaffold9969_cov67-Phaeocystis_antarctica.AAC.2